MSRDRYLHCCDFITVAVIVIRINERWQQFVMMATRYLLLCVSILVSIAIALPQYDYVVIGGGGGGAVIANRLSANPANSVLLIDMGPMSCRSCDAALGANTNTASPYARVNLPITQQYLLLARKPSLYQRYGLGGTTKSFGAVCNRASRPFLNTHYPVGYKYDDLLPEYKEVEDHFCHYLPTSVSNISVADCLAWHGQGGEMSVVPQVVSQVSPPMRDLIDYLGTTDVGNTTDYNNPNTKRGAAYEQRWGVMSNKSDVNSTRSRMDAQIGFLPDSVLARSNLDVLPFTRVTRLVIGNRNGEKYIKEVEFLTNGTIADSVKARRQVFLCAGVLETPKLLELSGIGDPTILASLGIPLQVNNTAVGKNLRAHHALIMSYRTKTGINHDGTKSSYNAGQIFINISASDERPADFQVELLDGFYVESVEGDANGLPIELVNGFLQGKSNGFPFIAAEIEHNDVTTIGYAHASTPDPTSPAAFDLGWGFNLFATSDIPKFLQAMAKVRNIFTGNNTFANKNIVEEVWPGDRYRKPYIAAGIPEPILTRLADTDALRSAMTHFFHLTGTCALGSCTNLDGEVLGVTGLSVCDNSLLPANPDANPTATLVAVCNKVAKRRLAKDE